MKKIILTAFITAMAVTSWSSLRMMDSSSYQASLSSVTAVEALTSNEAEIICSSGFCGRCFIRSNSGHCVYSGYTVDYCHC